ncbi:MAG: cyclophilin-like fold protein [Candidatus Odinarchaeota archaeon]
MNSNINVYPIIIEFIGVGEVSGELIRTKAPRTAEAIFYNLPIKDKVSLYGEEIYFKAGINLGKEKPVKTVSSGDIAYWPMGDALCLFFGKTQPYSEVNLCGRLIPPFDLLKDVKKGTGVIVKRRVD